MNLTSPSQVKDWCIRNGFHPNKVLGQNFLIDKNALDSILDAALIPESSRVEPNETPLPTKTLEIGPGLGVLTEGLLERGCTVTAIEKDPVLADRLKESLGNPERLTVLKGDALDYIKDGSCDGFPLMVSNLPYQAGTRILIELIDRIGRFEAPETIVVLVQTEVAERLAASEGSKVRGLAGVRVQFDYDVQIVRKVAASCFWPRPEIGSSVVKLTRHARNIDFSEEERAVFRRLTKKAFEHRRKQLGSIFKDLIQSTARAEELTNEDWINLSKGITQNENA
jgi:16S rRNA (adenine1518-N6/adenine1519-N6)-dimethyltransferase